MNNRLIRRFLSGLVLVSAVAAVHATDQESVTFTGVPMIATSNGGPTNYSWTPTVGGYALGRIRFSGNLTQVAAGDYMSENRFTVTTGGGAVSAVTAVSGTAGYTGTQPVSGSFFVGTGELVSTSLAWNFSFVNSFRDAAAGAGNRDATLDITYTLEDLVPPTWEDLGTLANGVTTITRTHTAQTMRWYKFTISESLDADKFLDIDTEGTTTFLGGSFTNDTFIGIYTMSGNLIGTADDDDGSDFRSLLTYGGTNAPRPPVGNGTTYDGRDGVLAADSYLLAVGGWPATWGATFWGAATTSNATGDVVVNFTTNTGVLAQLTGNVTLESWLGPVAGENVVVEITDGVNSQTAPVTLDSSGNYQLNLAPQIVPGTYDVYIKARHWLRRKVAGVTVTGSGASGVNVSLINGDCDDNNLNDSDDFDILVAGFGQGPGDPGYDDRCNLDGAGGVDSDDFDILIANFGLGGD